MIDEDVVQYHVPANTVLQFYFEPQQKELHLKLISGTAKLYFGDENVNLLQGENFILNLWNCLIPKLETTTVCEFEIQGSHYIYQAFTQKRSMTRVLFAVSQVPNGFVFVLDAAFQLKIFVSASTEFVQLAAVRGVPEVLGRPLSVNRKYYLIAGSSTLVNSRDSKPYSIAIYGTKRRVEITLWNKVILEHVENVHDQIRSLRQTLRCEGPVVLVLGPEFVGKTSICNFLLNKALEDGMRPVYIDLDVCRNISTIPGTISLREIQSVVFNSPTAFKHGQYVFQFGRTNFTNANIKLYMRLVRKISNLLGLMNKGCFRKRAGAIIDMCGTLGKNAETIKNVLRLFNIDIVVAVGDQSYYKFVASNVLTSAKTMFVPQPRNIKIQHKNWATTSYMTVLPKYFFGESAIPGEGFRAGFSNFKVYRCDEDYLIRTLNNCSKKYPEVSFRGELIECDPSMEMHVLGVVRSDKRDKEIALSEIDYFLCFARVNVEDKYAIAYAPRIELFKNKFLLLSDIRLVQNGFP